VILPNTEIGTRKRAYLYIFLSAIFLTNAILAEVIGVKIFSLEETIGVKPANIDLLGFSLSFNLTAGVLLWPFVFITSDVINEYFGKPGVRRISFLTAGFICYVFIAIWGTTGLPPAAFWLDVNKNLNGTNNFDINLAFNALFRQGLGIIIGSITAFLVGQLLDAYVFHAIKKYTGSSKIWLRATASTLVSQLIDSFVVLVVAFYIFGNWSFEQVIAVGIINYIYKSAMALLMIPLLYVAHYFIESYLGKEAK